MENIDNNKFYVYAYLDPRRQGKFLYEKEDIKIEFEFEPFYIGKGNKYRCNEHMFEAQNIQLSGLIINKNNFPNANIYKIRKILKIQKITNKNPIIRIIQSDLSELVSFDIERKYIQTIGRHDFGKGPLTNLTDGGGGVSNPSYEVRQLRSKVHKNKIVSKETRLKQRNAKLGTKASKSTRKKMSDERCGEKHWHFGKKGQDSPSYGFKHSKKSREKISKGHSKAIIQYDSNGTFIKEWPSATIASKILGKSRGNINACCRGERQHVGGFIWKFK